VSLGALAGVVEPVEAFAALGVRAFTTTRAAGDYAVPADGPDDAARRRWTGLLAALGEDVPGLASARQVHGVRVLKHAEAHAGWMRHDGADGHLSVAPGLALAVSVADCIPVFLAHPGGAVGLLHAGWRGVAGGILGQALADWRAAGLPLDEVHLHLGPAISGRAYEVGPDVYEALTGLATARPRHVDLRALLLEQARAAGLRHITVSLACTVEDNDRFFSHRAGDAGRQVAVIVTPLAASRLARMRG
jgi:polyphenol oxidase